MKTLKLLTCLMLAGGMLLATNPVNAQAYEYAASADFPMYTPGNLPVFNVENTGNDVGMYQSGDLFVMTWDGNRPSFGWDFGNNSVVNSQYIRGYITPGTISVSDPDIIIDPSQMETGMIAITYVLDRGMGNEIFVEMHKYTGTGFALIMPPTKVDGGLGDCSNPNIDISDGLHHAVITWEHAGTIYARALDFYNQHLEPNIFNVTPGCLQPGSNIQPDVAVFYNTYSPGHQVVSFTYITYSGSHKELVVQQEELSEIINNSQSNCQNVTVVYSINQNEILENPRIAAPTQWGNVQEDDFTAVVHHSDGSSYSRIVGFSNNMNQGPGNYTTTVIDNGLDQFVNSRPALSYADGDYVKVTWTYDDSYHGLISGSRDVVSRDYDYMNQNMLHPHTSIVNLNLNGEQLAASVAARNQTSGILMVYLYFNRDQQRMNYKITHPSHINIREGKPTAAETTLHTKLSVFPMPFTSKATLEYSIGKGETGVSLELYNLTGQKLRTFNLNGQKEGNHQTTLNKAEKGSELPAGVYLLRLNTNKTSQALRVVIGE